jgi:putative ABC transport system permease protein
MGLAFKIAWRNLWRHKGKSLVIGTILCFGTVLMTVGNGMISGMEAGLSQNIIRLFTGDIVLISTQQEKDNVLFDTESGKPLRVIHNFNEIKKTLNQEAIIQEYLPATAGYAFVLNSASKMGGVMLLGVDIGKYSKMFPGSFTVTEGQALKPGERGILVSEEARKQFYDFLKFWIVPEKETLDPQKLPKNVLRNINGLDWRSDLVIMGAGTSNSTMDIRVPVKGIIKYKSLNKIWGFYCIVDIESFREAYNYVTGADTKVVIPRETKSLLESENPDQLFSSGSTVTNATISDQNLSIQDIQAKTNKKTAVYGTDTGSFNMVFLLLKPGVTQTTALKKLNRVFRQQHLSIRAVGWKNAMGVIGSLAVMFKVALNIFIMFIFFVAIIVIMNTLSMAAIERIPEIGMMRAVGARKGFLRKMFVYETGILSFFFGGIGIMIGGIIIYLIQAAHITTTNEILQLIYGGDRLSPLFIISNLFLGIIELGIVTFLSVLYPLRIVGKIVPLDAISRE